MKKNSISIIGIIILAVAGVVAYSWSKKTVSPVDYPAVSTPPAFSPSFTPTPTPQLSPTPTPNVDISDWKTYKNYKLDCTDKPDSFQSKYSWYKHFKEQIIENWSLDIICYNGELNKVVFLDSKIDWKNYVYDSSRTFYGLSQLGIYDIEKDKNDKGQEKNLGFYEGCGIIKEWNKNNEIIYQCGSGDAGIGYTSTFSYNIFSKSIHLVKECNIKAGRLPEEICTEK